MFMVPTWAAIDQIVLCCLVLMGDVRTRLEKAEAGMGGMMGGGTITASEIDLEEQGVSGTVSGYSGAAAPTTFTLKLPSDSAFTTLTGSTNVTVFQQAGTEQWGITTIANGSVVHVRGLLFFDGDGYKLIAGRIIVP